MDSERLQAFLYRVVTTNGALSTLVMEGVIREPPGFIAGTSGTALEFFSIEEQQAAKRMGRMYELLHCFENSVRELIETTLKDVLAERWWAEGVDEGIRKKADSRRKDDEKARVARSSGSIRAELRRLHGTRQDHH